MLGWDISSPIHASPQPASSSIELNRPTQFLLMSGAFQHALMEWSAVSLAFVAVLAACMHYRARHDATVLIIGIAMMCAGILDAFHTLAATRIIVANVPDEDFVPFTWAMSRSFNSLIMIAAATVSLWILRMRSGRHALIESSSLTEKKTLIMTALVFVLLALGMCYWVVSATTLPKTQYPSALISRPFDVLPLALFLLAGVLFWIWYHKESNLLTFFLMLSILPATVTQLHMVFGSQSLFDHHFNIAHLIKIFAYLCVLLGILLDISEKPLIVPTSSKSVHHNAKLKTQLAVGKATRPLSIKIPISAFILSMAIAIILGASFYIETDRLLYQQETEELILESQLVEPLLEQLYENTLSDARYLSNLHSIQGLINAAYVRQVDQFDDWQRQIENDFSDFLLHKNNYAQVHFISFLDVQSSRIIVLKESERAIRKVSNVAKSLRSEGALINYAKKHIENIKNEDGDHTIDAQSMYRKEHLSRFNISTLVTHVSDDTIVGMIEITLDIRDFVQKLSKKELSGLAVYLANQRGAILFQPPDNASDNRLLTRSMKVLFPNTEFDQADVQLLPELKDIYGRVRSSIYRKVVLNSAQGDLSFQLLLQHTSQNRRSILESHRIRSLIISISLAVVALGLALMTTRRLTRPLIHMTDAIQHYEETGELQPLPIQSKDEIGMLARSFHNLMQRVNQSLTLQNASAENATESYDRMMAIVNNAAESIITINASGEILTFNRTAEVTFGYEESEIIGQPVTALMPQEYAQQHHQFIENYLNTGHTKIIGIGRELVAVKKSGEEFPIHLSISEVNTREGLVFTGLIRDITQLKQAEQALIKGKEAAEQAALYKTQFLASMSHEIRTPMNGVLGMLGLMLKAELTNEQRHRANLAKSSAESLLVLINDILDFSKVEAGKLELECIEFNLTNQISDFAQSIANLAQEKGLELIVNTRGIHHEMVKGDPGRIRQILTNLVGNAIKFTDTGEISIVAKLEKPLFNGLRLHCEIHDSGIGIAENKIENLFESFTQVDSTTTRKYGGTGLGLAIVRQLCQLMGGDVWVHSQEGVGSVFTFEIQLEPAHDRQITLPNMNLKHVPVLIVDDNATNREVLFGQLSLWEMDITEASSGQQALERLNERVKLNDEAFFKVAILDMQMPEMDGIELAQRIRKDTRFNAMQLIMMTSMSHRGDAHLYAELGFVAYFPKPVSASYLYDALQLVLSDGEALNRADPLVTRHYLQEIKSVPLENNLHQANPPSNESDSESATNIRINTQAASDANWPKNTRILLVEDNQINQIVAEGVLEDLQLGCECAANGLEALDALSQASEAEPYTLVLMDCQMPEMDGYDASRNIRQGKAGERYKHIPIIAMTANAMMGDREKCLEAGMSDYLSKPIDVDKLHALLKQWLAPAALNK